MTKGISSNRPRVEITTSSSSIATRGRKINGQRGCKEAAVCALSTVLSDSRVLSKYDNRRNPLWMGVHIGFAAYLFG